MKRAKRWKSDVHDTQLHSAAAMIPNPFAQLLCTATVLHRCVALRVRYMERNDLPHFCRYQMERFDGVWKSAAGRKVLASKNLATLSSL